MKRKIYSLCYLLFSICILLSCKEEEAATLTDEPIKDITGTWKIVSLTRNGEELVQRMDLSKFSVSFNADGTYNLQDKISFPVSEPGTYKLNDPQYPSTLVLTPQSETAQNIKLLFPVIEGKRQLSLSFSPGCTGNTYQYNFSRQN